MFDIGFWEIVLISVIGLIVLGPERLPVAIRTVLRWVRIVKGAANSMKNEISQELKIHELHENLRKAEQQGMQDISPELSESVESLKQAAQSVTRPYAKSVPDAETVPVNQAPEPSSSAATASADVITPNTPPQADVQEKK